MAERVGKQQRHLVVGDERQQGGGARGAGGGDDRHDLVLFGELASGGDGARRVIAVILGDQLDLAAADAALVVDRGDRDGQPVPHAAAEQRERAGERADIADAVSARPPRKTRSAG